MIAGQGVPLFPSAPLALFLVGFGALGWWACDSVATLYRRRGRLGLSYRLYLLLPGLWGRFLARNPQLEKSETS